MEVEENGCDVSADNENINLIFASEENTRESIGEAEEVTDEQPTEAEIPKLEEIIKAAKNIKAKNDIEDDIRMICGSEELNRTSQDKEETVDNNILETLQEQTEHISEEIVEEIVKEENYEQINLKRSHSQTSIEINIEDEQQDLFGFYEGKFVFGKKIKINSNEVDNEIIGPKFKRMVSNTERILEELDAVQKNIREQNGKLDQTDSDIQKNTTEIKTSATTTINENDETKVSPSVSATASPIQTSSHSSHKLRPSEDPIYRKPFEMGWKREYVLRALPGSKDKGEVYYITPNGKKLRTRHEIQVNLTPGLTLENFTFSKDALGADPEDEIIRSAKPTGRNIETSTPKIPEISTPTSGKRIPKPKAPKGASPPPQGWTPTQAVKTQGSRAHIRYPASTTDDYHSKSLRISSSTGGENSGNTKSGNSSKKHVELSASTGSNKSSPIKIQYIDSYVHNLFGNVSGAYDIILDVFKYLKVQELLRAACVSRLWNHLANERSLWKIVRMKNSQVNDWAGFAATLSRNSTQHLDLRKMICPKSGVDKMWTNFNENIQKVFTLRTIDLGRCPASVVQNLFLATPQLNVLNATSIKSQTINLENLNKLSNLTELRLKSVECCNLVGDLSSFAFLTNLKHLSLTLIDDLGTKNIEILGQLTELESLEIGECTSIQQNFASDVLANLKKLQRLRLEKSTEINVTFSILEQISEMENLHQLELVNFDIRDGFEQKIIACKNLKRFLLIPTYVSQSATTNQIILSSMRKLKTLESFTWVVTLELLSVTALYVDQCGSKDRRNFNDSIPVLKPVPGASHKEKQEITNKATNADIQQIEILPLSTITEILDDGTPDTKHKIVRVAYATTWRQAFVE